MAKLDLRTILLGLAVLVLGLISFNQTLSLKDERTENEQLTKEVERLKTVQSQEQAIYSRTEDFLQATLEGGAIDYFSTELTEKTEAELDEDHHLHDGSRSQMEDFEIFNISVQQKEEAYQVYAIYKVALTGVDGELEHPGDQPLLYLTSRITWIEEDGEWKVDAHELQPLASGEEVTEAISNG
ncbi:hypothetical protein [Planomicrobium okeanokoites]|uniref:hypothetical protein n=1 Tax=Planomicrobium okeanokoites TaxID=244 RepID=UPI003566DD89